MTVEPCENCGTPVRLVVLEPTGRHTWLHLTAEASEFTDWMEEWQEHRPEQCHAIRDLLTARRQETL